MVCGRPSITTETSKLVPPTSAAITWSIPSSRARPAAPSTPATGPEMIVSNGRSAASSKVIAPPPERISSVVAEQPSSAKPPPSRSR